MNDEVSYDRLPEHMRDAARRYVEERRRPGSFLFAVLCNNLVEAYGQADAINTERIRDWASWLWNEAPRACWGSPEKVAAWLRNGEQA